MHGHALVQETLEEGCKKIDDIVESFDNVGLRDRSMVWNTDLVEVMSQPQPLPCISHDQLTRLVRDLDCVISIYWRRMCGEGSSPVKIVRISTDCKLLRQAFFAAGSGRRAVL